MNRRLYLYLYGAAVYGACLLAGVALCDYLINHFWNQ